MSRPGSPTATKVTRQPMTKAVTIVNGQGYAMANGYHFFGYVGSNFVNQKWKCAVPSGQGVMLCVPTQEKPKRHHIQCAEGVDAALQACPRCCPARPYLPGRGRCTQLI